MKIYIFFIFGTNMDLEDHSSIRDQFYLIYVFFLNKEYDKKQ